MPLGPPAPVKPGASRGPRICLLARVRAPRRHLLGLGRQHLARRRHRCFRCGPTHGLRGGCPSSRTPSPFHPSGARPCYGPWPLRPATSGPDLSPSQGEAPPTWRRPPPCPWSSSRTRSWPASSGAARERRLTPTSSTGPSETCTRPARSRHWWPPSTSPPTLPYVAVHGLLGTASPARWRLPPLSWSGRSPAPPSSSPAGD